MQVCLRQAPFNITTGIDGSATSFTITYINSISGSICGFNGIVASSCASRVCTDWFDLSSSPCKNSSNITVAAFATNVLGDGLPSQMFVYLFKGVCVCLCLCVYNVCLCMHVCVCMCVCVRVHARTCV